MIEDQRATIEELKARFQMEIEMLKTYISTGCVGRLDGPLLAELIRQTKGSGATTLRWKEGG